MHVYRRPKYWMCYTVQFANYTCSGSAEEEVYRVTFLYMGFRYDRTPAHTHRWSSLGSLSFLCLCFSLRGLVILTCACVDVRAYVCTCRYVQITGHPSKPTYDDVTAHFIHTDLDKSGSFTSSNEVLNKIQHATRYAAMSNFMDIPTDCKSRTRL